MLTWIELTGVRNLRQQRVATARDLVVVTGGNAQGKSSFLEAVYLLATTRSPRSRDPRDAIQHDAPQLTVVGEVDEQGVGPLRRGMTLGRRRGDRRFFVGEYDAKLPEYLALLPALAVSGDSIRSVAGSPGERRRLIDRATAAARPEHIQDLADFRRALAQRNALLREEARDAEIGPWEEVLDRVGTIVARRRREHVEAWQGALPSWPGLFPEGREAQLRYRESGAPSLRERLERTRGTDRKAGFTQVGPHRDDLDVEVEGRSLLRFGSAGQVRAALIALMLAQARVVRASRTDRSPLLLIDDADTDLDRDRLEALLEAARQEGQTFAATAKWAVGEEVGALRLTAREGLLAAG